MDHYATRYPTNVVDIGNFLVKLTGMLLHRYHSERSSLIYESQSSRNPSLPFSTIPPRKPFTKYEICLVYSKILGLPHKHIIPDAEPPTGPGATTRPKDCQLYTGETEDLGVEGGLGLSLFEEWWTQYLKK